MGTLTISDWVAKSDDSIVYKKLPAFGNLISYAPFAFALKRPIIVLSLTFLIVIFKFK